MIHYNQILPELYVGTYPQDPMDIQLLKNRSRVTAVLNLQSDEDFEEREIDWPALEAVYQNLSIEVRRVPMRDFDHDDQAEKLAEAVEMLAALLNAGHVVYLHCNAGMGRSPLTAMAYLYWHRNISREDAISYVKMRRPCFPYEDLLEAALKDETT